MDSDGYKQDKNAKLMVMMMMIVLFIMTMVIMITLMIVMMSSWLERVWTWGRHEYSKKQLPGLIGREAPLHGDDDCNDGGYILDDWTDPLSIL